MKKGGGKKGAGGGGAGPDRPVDISRLDLRVGVVISAEKVWHYSGTSEQRTLRAQRFCPL